VSIEVLTPILPKLNLPKTRIETYEREGSEREVALLPDSLTPEQKQYLLARYLVDIIGKEVFVNTIQLK